MLTKFNNKMCMEDNHNDDQKEGIKRCIEIQKKVVQVIKDYSEYDGLSALGVLLIANFIGTKKQFLDMMDRNWHAVTGELSDEL